MNSQPPAVDSAALIRPPLPLRQVDLLGIACGIGGPNAGTADGPAALRRRGLVERLRDAGVRAHWLDLLAPAPLDAPAAQRIAALAERQSAASAASVAAGHLPLVLGGDHAVAIGTWRGVLQGAAAAVGLVWVDAHLDSHTVHSSHSKRVHGMPLAALLGHGEPPLVLPDQPRLQPAHVSILGARAFEPEEQALLERLGVRIFYMPEVERLGLAEALRQAIAVANAAPGGYGLSIDLDAFDPVDAPGVGVPEAQGLRGVELLPLLAGLGADPRLRALEIVEYDPHRDHDGRTGELAQRLAQTLLAPGAPALIAAEARFGAHNYAPLPVVLSRGEGCWLFDVDGRRYLDMMSAYSAVSFGHAHPRLLHALTEQAQRLAVTSRAYHNDRLPLLLARLSALTGMDRALPMNTGMEAVETAIKAARKWAWQHKGVPEGEAQIIVCGGNFHGRSTTIVGFSSEPQYRAGFGPYDGGFRCIPYGDASALAAAMGPHTAAFLVEPIQGEAGVRVPPPGWLAQCAQLCQQHRVLLLADEIQTGLGRTGALLACQHEGVRPDGLMLGKALGGGLLPVSAFLARDEVMSVFQPGDHGSTFGGNALAAAVALEALALLEEEDLCAQAQRLGAYLQARLSALTHPAIVEVRGRGLMIGVEIDPAHADAHALTLALAERGVLTKDTHGTVLRFAPPLTINETQIDLAIEALDAALQACGQA